MKEDSSEVSKTFDSRVSDGVLADVETWCNGRIEAVYVFVHSDELFVKVLHEGVSNHRTIYAALGVATEGRMDVLGRRRADTEHQAAAAMDPFAAERREVNPALVRP